MSGQVAWVVVVINTRTTRGGAWGNPIAIMQLTYRGWWWYFKTRYYYGFRVCRDIEKTLDIIQPRSSKDRETTNSDIENTDPETNSLDFELLAFMDALESDNQLDSDIPPADSSDDSAEPEDDDDDEPKSKKEKSSKKKKADEDEVDRSDDERIAVEEATVFTFFEASDRIYGLDPKNFNNEDSIIVLTNEIGIVLAMIDEGLHIEALDKLHDDILERTDGCANIGEPDENDWIRTYEGQGLVYPLIVEAIELLESLLQ